LKGRDRRISEFEASLIYRVSSRTARATERNPVSKKPKKKKKNFFLQSQIKGLKTKKVERLQGHSNGGLQRKRASSRHNNNAHMNSLSLWQHKKRYVQLQAR
jgi:hypothetical protein